MYQCVKRLWEVGDLVVHLSAPVLALTATITKYMQNDIFRTLHLDVDNWTVVAELPDSYQNFFKYTFKFICN